MTKNKIRQIANRHRRYVSLHELLIEKRLKEICVFNNIDIFEPFGNEPDRVVTFDVRRK